MAELIIEYGEQRASIQIDDPGMPPDKLAVLLLGAADDVMGRRGREFAAVSEDAERRGFVFGRDKLTPADN